MGFCKRYQPLLTALLLSTLSIYGQSQANAQVNPNPEAGSLNKPDRLDWFQDQGFGLFIHWSVDVQLGVGISHSLVGASDDYTNRFYNELPRTFDPEQFHPEDWARLARIAGVRYVMFTTKHHSGFAMYDTATTDFGVMHTPFHRDITAEVFKAFRDQGIAPGVYFSPDDFYWLHNHGKLIQRGVPDVQPANNPGLMAYDQAQVRELLTKYGPISLIFFDGQPTGLRELAWKLQPGIVVTRGALQTPEQYVPGMPLKGAWEANLTIGQAWQYQPQNDPYKSGRQLIRTLIQTRAKGGNLLLDVGPKPNGELPIQEEDRLREIGLWMFVNSEAIYGVRPWVITNEGDVWFTKKKNENTVYAIVDSNEPWEYGKWQDLVLRSVGASDQTEVSVLGENGKVLEYQPQVNPKPSWEMKSDGLHIHAMRAQRLQDNHKWPNPVVLRITNVKPAFTPPQVETRTSSENADHSELLTGSLTDMGGSSSLQVGFEYRSISGEDVHARTEPWTATPLQPVTHTGEFSYRLENLPPGIYEFHAVVKHPLVTLFGADVKMQR
ncbi:MAG TPA: alpha-L-fucosidase [Acidobacteriaceae bacterium]|nr:alpha-L-fucosidase [Acidobacteriaceae bacterium]